MTYAEPVTDAGRTAGHLAVGDRRVADRRVLRDHGVQRRPCRFTRSTSASGAVAADVSISEYHDMLAGVRGLPVSVALARHVSRLRRRATDRPQSASDRPRGENAAVVRVDGVSCSGSAAGTRPRRAPWLSSASTCCSPSSASSRSSTGIYFTNDYAMIACWFGAVYMLRREQYVAASAFTFVGAWAKETMLLVPDIPGLPGVSHLKTRAPRDLAIAAVAFVVPTAILRRVCTHAAVGLGVVAHDDRQRAVSSIVAGRLQGQTIKNNAKVALFYNVLWVMAARQVIPNVGAVHERSRGDGCRVSDSRVSGDLHS